MKIGDHRVSRRWLLGALAAGTAAAPALATAPGRSLQPEPRPGTVATRARVLAPTAGSLVQNARLGGTVGFAVADAATGQVLESSNATTALPPASVAKAITALYALDRLGPDHRFETRIVATGPMNGNRLEGDLILLGGGDPTLDTDTLGDLADALVARGIRRIRGRFLVSGAPLPTVDSIDPEQPVHVGYSPAVSGLSLNFNRVHFEWSRTGSGYRIGMDARSARYRPRVYTTRMEVVGGDGPLYTHRKTASREDWTVRRNALGGAGTRWLPVRLPEIYAGDVFQTLARAKGLPLPNPQQTSRPPGGTVIARHRSAALRPILRDMLRYSTNISAELVGMSASAAGGRAPRDLADSGARMAAWAEARLGLRGARFVDHSGLGDDSRLSAQALAVILASPSVEAALRGILRPFAMRDSQGRIVPDHPLEVAAKTGTLNFVSGLGGYVTTPGGADLVFAIFAADTDRRDGLSRGQRERPQGGRDWVRRARVLQSQLLERWAAVYSG